MQISSLFKRMHDTAQEVSILGPAVLMRHFHRASQMAATTKHATKLITRIGPVYLRLHDTDFFVLRQIFIRSEYNLDRAPQGKTVRKRYLDIITRGKTPIIIDAGANIGLASRFFSLAYPASIVIAIEPDPANIDVCKQNTKDFPNIEVVEAAIGSTSGYVSVMSEANDSWAAQTVRAAEGLPVVTIPELVLRYPDSELLIVKVDIEGFEKDLFASNLDWIEDVTALIVEPHDWLFPGEGSSHYLQRAMLKGDRELLILGENLAWIKAM